MSSPFLAASRRQGSNRRADYQSPGREYRGPRGPAANENMPFAPSRIPNSGGPYIAPLVRTADSLLMRMPAYRIGRLMFDLYAWSKGQFEILPHPDYSPHFVYQHTCTGIAADIGNFVGYLRNFNFGVGQCGGFEPWKRGATEAGPLDPYFGTTREFGADVPANWLGMATVREANWTGAQYWEQAHIVYDRVETGIATYKGINAGQSAKPKFNATPRPGQLPWPALAPETLPIGGFAPMAHPIPLAWLSFRPLSNPMRSPSEQSSRGPARVITNLPNLAPRTDLTTPVVSVTPSPSGSVKVRAALHYARRPPKPGMKERKATVRGVGGILMAVNALTEGFDFIAALYKALPSHMKKDGPYKGLRRQLRPHEQLQQIYRHYGDVDLKDAVKNLIENEAEDRVFGGIGQGLKKLNRDMGRPVGVQAGQGGPGKVPKGTQMGQKPWDNWMDYVWP